jgi:alkyl hydroperoxide reductase subunit F
MLDNALKEQVKSLFASLQHQYIFQVEVADNHSSKDELVGLLQDVASCSNHIELKINSGNGLKFSILQNNKLTGVTFRAVPNGHEFTTLLLAILNLEGIGKNLPDPAILNRIKAIDIDIEIKSYISLSCTNCPDVVQALNIMTFNNPRFQHYIIDGAINEDEANTLNIKAVPSVYVNGQLLHVGRSSLGELLEKIENMAGVQPVVVDTKPQSYDVIVVGAGPAGTSAAIYSARKGQRVAIVAQKIGGQVTETVAIENMISVPQTTGQQLAAQLKTHINDYSIDVFENRLVRLIDIVDGIKQVHTSLGEILEAPALIVATGASWRKLNVPGESDYIGSGVAFCTHCDGPFYKNKKVVVVGGGNSGLEAAIDLASIATEVIVLEYMDELKGDVILQNKLQSFSNVKVVTSAETLAVKGDGAKVTGLQFKHRHTGVVADLSIDGVFVQIGLKANSQVVANVVETNRMGEILVDAHCRTAQPGIYAAGDVSVVPYKQIVIAMGEGAKAALSAFEDRIKGVIGMN